MIAEVFIEVYALRVDISPEKKVIWTAVIVIAAVFIYSSDFNPFRQKSPDWKVIKEAVAASVYCTDWDTNDYGEVTTGYAPCVKLSNVTYDATLGDQYCYSADANLGGIWGETYEGISSWQLAGNEYYCVTWTAKYNDSDMNNPSDWRIDFGSKSPANLL
jgi:hypothetical protein